MRKLIHVKRLGFWSSSALVAVAMQMSAAQAAQITWNASYFNDVGLSASDFNKFQANVNTTLNYYTSTWSAPNAVTIKIEFHAGNTGLGTTTSYYAPVGYQAYRNALATTGTSADDATALAFLPNAANNPTNGNTQVSMSLPLQRAMGLSNIMPPGADPDSSVVLNTTLMTIDRADPIAPGTYDLQQVVYHELNEVIGFTSGLNGVPNNPITVPAGAIQPADLWRYRGVGLRSFTSDPNEACYFSINNGVTNLANYNTSDGGDRQDFNGLPNPSVQDAFSTPDIRLNNALAEETFIDVIGYNRVPEPAGLGLLALSAIALVRKRR